MKKIFIIITVILITFVVCTLTSSVYAAELTLEDIAGKFNENADEIYKDLDVDGFLVEATATETGITLSYTYESETFENTWNFSEGVLQGTMDMGALLSSFLEIWSASVGSMGTEEIPTEQIDENSINLLRELVKLYEYMDLLVSIGELQGYTHDYMMGIITLEELQQYTLENEGMSATSTGEDEEMIVEMRVSTQYMNLDVDMDSVYFEVPDLSYDFPDESSDGKKGYLYFKKNNNLDGSEIISIAQKTELSDITYKSIESMIEAMYGNAYAINQFQEYNTAFNEKSAVNYFKSVYENFDVGAYAGDGFKLEINPVMNTDESGFIDENHDFVRLTINPEEFEAEVLAYVNALSPSTIVTNNNGEGEYNGNLPDTGRRIGMNDYIIIGFMLSAGFASFIFMQAKVKNKTKKDV